MSYTHEQIRAIFSPGAIAVVVAPEHNEAGSKLLENLLSQGFKGEVFTVTQTADEMLGLKRYPDMCSIPRDVDLAAVLVGTGQLHGAIDDCVRKKVKAAIIFNHGSSESNDSGTHGTEREVLAIARSGNVRLLGLNSMGACCTATGLCFSSSICDSSAGSVAFISQGGTSGAFVTLMGSIKGMGFSKVVSTGSECDLSTSDFIDYLADDEKTRIIMVHLESAHDGRTLLRSLREASLRKPVILWKTGLAPTPGQGVLPNTAAFAQSEALWDAALNQAGATRAYDVEEMVDIATTFYYLPESRGRRVSIISGPGGPAVAASDALEQNGLFAAQLKHESVEKLRRIVPPAGASLRNPIDLGVAPWAIISLYSDTLRVVDKDENVDATLLIGGGITAGSQQEYVELMVDLKKTLKKPCMLITWAGLRGDTESAKILQGAGYPLYTGPERALSSYSKMVKYYEWRSSLPKTADCAHNPRK